MNDTDLDLDDDVDIDDQADTDHDDSGPDGDDVEEGPSRDELQAQIRKLERALERQRKRTEKPDPAKTDDGPDPAVEAVTRANARIVATEARAALVAAGLDRDAAKVAVRMLDLSTVEVDDDGDVDEDDLTAAVDELREKLPQLFTPPADDGDGEPPRRKARKVNTGPAEKTAPSKSAAELLLERAGFPVR